MCTDEAADRGDVDIGSATGTIFCVVLLALLLLELLASFESETDPEDGENSRLARGARGRYLSGAGEDAGPRGFILFRPPGEPTLRDTVTRGVTL